MTPPRSILILSLKYLGDVIVATPALRGVHESFPHARITMAVPTGYEDALVGNPAVDEIISIPLDTFRNGSIRSRLGAQWRLVRALRRNRYDCVIVLEPGDREVLLAWLSGAGMRVGPAYQSLAFLLTTRVPIRENAQSYIDYYCAIVEAAGAKARSKTTEMFVAARDASWAKTVIGGWDYVIGLHPGARETDRLWPAERWAALAHRCIARGNTHIVLMTSPSETHLADAISSALPDPAMITRTDNLSIARTAALMQRCNICVTCDSAPRHIAAAVGTRTLALLPARSSVPWRLYDPVQHAVVIDSGSEKDGLIARITVDEVFAKIS